MHCSKAKATADLVRDPIVFLRPATWNLSLAPLLAWSARGREKAIGASLRRAMSARAVAGRCDRIDPRREIVIQSAAVWL
jgi:hypothetical protein